MNISLSPLQQEVFSLVVENLGKENVFLVGGSLRDALLGKESLDMDFAVPVDCHKVLEAFPYGTLFEKFGTLSFRLGRVKVTIATFRQEEGYKDYRHPCSVRFVRSLYQDFKRRDFTMNALYCDYSLDVKDPTGKGIKDIRKRIIRMVGNPFRRLKEDPLRIIRAYRFKKEMDFRFDPFLSLAIKARRKLISHLNPDKVREELRKIDENDRKEIIEELSLSYLFEESE